MESRFQSLLDAQWDALEARDSSVRKIRAELDESLGEHAALLRDQLSTIGQKVAAQRDTLRKSARAEKERIELKSRLNKEYESDLAAESKDLAEKIEDLDKTIAELMAKRAELDGKRRELDSVISSRTSIYIDKLADLDREYPPDLAVHNKQQEARIAQLETEKKELNTELEAARDGRELWKTVCNELTSLDEEIKGIKRSQLPALSFVVTQASQSIEKCLETASSAGWSALVVAIGHELQILHDTLEAIHKASGVKEESP